MPNMTVLLHKKNQKEREIVMVERQIVLPCLEGVTPNNSFNGQNMALVYFHSTILNLNIFFYKYDIQA
jgi:hypothetical protein